MQVVQNNMQIVFIQKLEVYCKKTMKAFIDKYLDFTISKKLFAFLIACVALFLDKMNGEQWMIMSSVYIGTQGVIDVIKEYTNK